MVLSNRLRGLARDPVLASLSAGILWGSLAGLLTAILEWRTQGYLAANLEGAALESLARHLSAWVPPLGLVALLAALATAGWLRWRGHGARSDLVLAVGTAAPPVAALLWLANRHLPLPDATSAPGVALNGAVLAAGVAGLAVLLFLLERRAPRLSPRRWAAATAFVALAACAGLAAWGSWREPATRRPLNVVLVTVDTLRADHLGAYGYRRDTSPRFDAFAASGTLFQDAAAQWPATAPSFASLLTSTYAHQHGVTTNVRQRLRPSAVTLPEVLRDRGYRTAAFVTNANLSAKAQYDQGFDEYGELWRADRDPTADQPLAKARHWLRERRGDGPFFLWLHFLDPHAPYRPGAPYDRLWDDAAPAGRPERVPAPRNSPQDAGIGAIPAYAVLDGPQDRRFYVGRYDGEIRRVDDAFGALLDELDALGLAGDTLVIFTADHGESLGEHDYWFAHGRLPYQNCLRVPLAVRGPGVPAGRVVADPVQLVDVAPTVAGALRTRSHPSWRGRNLLPLMEGRPGASSPYAFSQAGVRGARQHVVRSGIWKLVWATDPEDRRVMTGQPFELYDLQSDPGETVNLAQARSDVSAELVSVLRTWLEGTGGTPEGGGAAADEAGAMDAETEQNLRALGYVR